MISPRNKEQAGLHIAKDTQISQANIVGLSGHQKTGQASTVRRPTTAYRSNTIPSQPYEEAKATGDSPKRKVRHSSSLQGNSELFLSLTCPKQLSCNPKLRYSNSPKHTMDDSSSPQSQNRETQPTYWKSTAHSTHNSSK